jgi:hypothetical protein
MTINKTPAPLRIVFNQKTHEYATPVKTGKSMTLEQYRKSIGMK